MAKPSTYRTTSPAGSKGKFPAFAGPVEAKGGAAGAVATDKIKLPKVSKRLVPAKPKYKTT